MAEKEYIERESLISDIKELPEQERIEYMGIYDCIKSHPTTDVQEVRHGKWIYEDSDIGWADYKCSTCGECYVLEAGTPQENKYNFCPNCGAKMDKE